ncbi:hypothetical protein TWF696_006464 [Orbilia brochopaga]|uniref:Uncharacterized protein n=1 Tax=Orbilia brochopaga TaxID=3140254 RepID=A0AAV9UX04_9PEZI
MFQSYFQHVTCTPNLAWENIPRPVECAQPGRQLAQPEDSPTTRRNQTIESEKFSPTRQRGLVSSQEEYGMGNSVQRKSNFKSEVGLSTGCRLRNHVMPSSQRAA